MMNRVPIGFIFQRIGYFKKNLAHDIGSLLITHTIAYLKNKHKIRYSKTLLFYTKRIEVME